VAAIPFVKVEGLGNDFVVVDLRPGHPAATAAPSPIDPQVAQAICDRHFGVGADGVLAILPGVDGDARMRVINADGSEAEMCGNGIRCVAKVLYETDTALRRPILRIDTGAGLLTCGMDAVDGRIRSVSVEMGAPRLLRSEIPMAGPEFERVLRATVPATERMGDRKSSGRRGDSRSFVMTAVSMGNPHAVIFVDDPNASLRLLAETYGPRIEVDPLFPRRTNVEFARVRDGAAGPEIDVVVWERGCGITLACGTGACATAVAACLEGRITAGGEIPVHLPGGALFITVRPSNQGDKAGADFGSVAMRGPANTVFNAQIDTEELMRGGDIGGRGGGRS
jgi:diaminopimelate epimerase